ncbi:MarR family winged helix-turn-helix transcriptional regulator [Streptomyces sp. NPDC046821]|uniref:MarR family winged helix-turn-helix transcriptional regulator n=1 Tax=Streptomyces sp. NPDC046821 TaxID=3154702 RepID=UPI0033EDACBD
MEYSHNDAELIQQPIGYWAWAAHDAVVTRTRGALAEKGTTQPQWWVLAQVAGADHVMTRDEVSDILAGYLKAGKTVLAEEIDTTIARGWIDEDASGRLTLTATGKESFDELAALQKDLGAERHAGISDEEYLTTMKVLQRFIRNTGGSAWHH